MPRRIDVQAKEMQKIRERCEAAKERNLPDDHPDKKLLMDKRNDKEYMLDRIKREILAGMGYDPLTVDEAEIPSKVLGSVGGMARAMYDKLKEDEVR